jgi:hypothetical protein
MQFQINSDTGNNATAQPSGAQVACPGSVSLGASLLLSVGGNMYVKE